MKSFRKDAGMERIRKGERTVKKNKWFLITSLGEREVGGCEICMRKRKKVREITHKYTV